MVNISNCPLTGLKRKVEYDFLIFKSARQIIIDCTVKYYDVNDNYISNQRIKDYKRALIASDSYVNPVNGALVEKDTEGNYPIGSIQEFGYYNALGTMNVAIYPQIEQVIALRDTEGKFNI